MEYGITYEVQSQTNTHVLIRERIDLTHPDCPVVCLDNEASFIERVFLVSIAEYLGRFGRSQQP
jgi:hypothetical protein